MSSVLGVSVGASAVRFARRDGENVDDHVFHTRPMTALLDRPADLAADSLETVLADTGEIEQVQAIGVAYRDEAQAGAIRTAMTRLDIDHFRLVPEVTAALEMLEMSGVLGDHETLLFYDLGSSGLTVTVVDRPTGTILDSARTDRISGDLVDRLIYDHHLELNRFTEPADTATKLALTERCRAAKEQLSTTHVVCEPGEGGLLLLSQDTFASIIDGPVKTSARLTREVIRRAGRTPDAAVLIGGGANIPLVTSVMETWLDLPVIVPAQPELVAAEGAALLADPAGAVTRTMALPAVTAAPTEVHARIDLPEPTYVVETDPAPRRQWRPLLVGVAVAVAAVLGLGVGAGLFQSSGPDPAPTATEENTSAVTQQPTPVEPTTTTDTAPAPESTTAVVEPVTSERSETPLIDGTGTIPPARPDTAPAPAPAPAPLIPGLPQIQLPTLPAPPPIQFPQLPRIPGL